MAKAINYLTDGTPWAIEETALRNILTIANRDNNLEAVLKERGKPMDNTHKVEMRGGVALIPVTGALFPRANLFSEVSGAYSVDLLAKDLAATENDPNVRAVVLMIDSPGGKTTMINEFANQIADYPKPVTAYVVGQAASAAYWLAAAADNVVLDASAIVGSIGVVLSMAKNTDGTVDIVSSNAPDKRPDVNTDGGKAVLQKVVDDMEAVFINAVAGFRGMAPEQITALRGGVLVGASAVQSGLADAVGNLESVISNLQKETTMDLATLKADHKEIYQAAFNEGKASLNAEALQTEAVAKERARFAAVQADANYEGREATANKLLADTDMDAAAIAGILATVPKATASAAPAPGGSAFEQHMAKIGTHNIGAGASSDANPDDMEAAAGWDKAIKPYAIKGGKQ